MYSFEIGNEQITLHEEETVIIVESSIEYNEHHNKNIHANYSCNSDTCKFDEVIAFLTNFDQLNDMDKRLTLMSINVLNKNKDLFGIKHIAAIKFNVGIHSLYFANQTASNKKCLEFHSSVFRRKLYQHNYLSNYVKRMFKWW